MTDPHSETTTRRHLRWAVNAAGAVAFWWGFITLINEPETYGLVKAAAFTVGAWIIQVALERQGYRRGWDDGTDTATREARDDAIEAKRLLALAWEQDLGEGCTCDWDDHGEGMWHIDRISPFCRMHGRNLRFALDLARFRAQHLYGLRTNGDWPNTPGGPTA